MNHATVPDAIRRRTGRRKYLINHDLRVLSATVAPIAVLHVGYRVGPCRAEERGRRVVATFRWLRTWANGWRGVGRRIDASDDPRDLFRVPFNLLGYVGWAEADLLKPLCAAQRAEGEDHHVDRGVAHRTSAVQTVFDTTASMTLDYGRGNNLNLFRT